MKDGEDEPENRPLTISFNGGPGSSSVWLHLGILGPKRVVSEKKDSAESVAPPYSLINNDFSILDKTDLIFIDPTSTGYSRAVPGLKAIELHGFKHDLESVGEFIRILVTRFKRWASPKFLIGESYGTTRASGLAGHLQEKHGMFLNGIMLISSILNFQTARFTPGNDLPPTLFLPTYCAIAFYHKQLDNELQKDLRATLNEVEEFAMTEYTLALLKGDGLSEEDELNIATKLSRYTGLSVDYIRQTNLRIVIGKFVKELLRSQRRVVGRLDGRYIGIDRDAVGEEMKYDPSMAAIMGPYTATLNDYVRRDLNYETDLPYEILTSLYEKWTFQENEYLDVSETLRDAMTKNQNLKVFVANGYYDLTTPYFATNYTFNHLSLDRSLRGNISMSYYEAGHMMYIHEPSLKKQRTDLVTFIDQSV